MTRPGIEHRSPGPLTNTLHIRPMSTQFICQKILFQVIHFTQTVLIQPIKFSISIDFVYPVKCQNSSILNNSI